MTPPSFEISTPGALWLLAGVIFLWLFWQGSSVGNSAIRRRLQLILRCLLLVLVVLALADIKWNKSSTDKHYVLLVDASDSLGPNAGGAARKFLESANLRNDQFTEVQFAERPALSGENAGSPGETNIEKALRFGLASFPAGRARHLLLFSDGRETRGDFTKALPALRDAGVLVDAISVNPPEIPEVLVESLSGPSDAIQNEPFLVRLNIRTNVGTGAVIDLFANDLLAGSREVTLKPGANAFELTHRQASGGPVVLRSVVRASPDANANNNEAEISVLVEGGRRILVVAEQENPSLITALQRQGFEVEFRNPGGIPERPGQLEAFDAVIMEDVPAASLNDSRMRSLVSYVKDLGGGLVMLGSGNSFGPGGYAGSILEEILPVTAEARKEKEDPSLALVAVMDSSGSMTGEKIQMAASAAMAAVGVLTPLDSAGVVAFSGEARWVADLQSANNAGGIAARIATLEAGGGTNISAGLELAWEALRRSQAKIKHIILLSDGVSIPGPYEEITARLTADKITLSTVGIGGDADALLLDQLATWGNGRYYHTDSPENIPQIFARETVLAARPAIKEVPFLPVLMKPAPFLEGLGFPEVPPLLGYVSTVLQPGADLWLAAESGEPLLATWRPGLGKVAAFTSDAGDRWATEWLGWDAYASFWSQLVREIQRSGDMKSFAMTTHRTPRGILVRAEAADVLGNPLTDPKGTVQFTSKEQSREVPFRQTGPGVLEAFLNDPGDVPWFAKASLTQAGIPLASRSAGISVLPAREALLEPPDLERLSLLATETGGSLNPDTSRILDAAPRPQASRESLWPLFLLAALAVFLADVALRRLP